MKGGEGVGDRGDHGFFTKWLMETSTREAATT